MGKISIDPKKDEQIPILAAQGKNLQGIADELGISIGTVWNHLRGKYKNKNKEPPKQTTPPQRGVTPKEIPLSGTKVNTVPQNPSESNILKIDSYTQSQLLQNARQQDMREEQNKILVEYLKQQFEDFIKDNERASERQQSIDRDIAELRQLLQQKEQLDETKIALIEKRINQPIQEKNKPNKTPQKTLSDDENRKPLKEQPKVKTPSNQPQSPLQKIQKSIHDQKVEEETMRENLSVIPSEPQRNRSPELKIIGSDPEKNVDYGALIVAKSIIEAVRPWVNPKNETTKQTCVSFGLFNRIYIQDRINQKQFFIPYDKMPKPYLDKNTLIRMITTMQ